MTVDDVRALYAGVGEVLFHRAYVGVLLDEIERLKAGRFTEEEFQNLCHTFTPDDRARFEAGCRAYQDKLFGGRPAAPREGPA